jgi:hypothetical protein
LPSSLTTLLPSALGFSPHLPVSVYGTGTNKTIAAFLGSVGAATSLLLFRSLSHFTINQRICLSVLALCLTGSFHSPVCLPSCFPTVLFISSTGISTCCPSTTAFALALGPDLPRADQLYSGNLRYSAKKILASFSLLIPAFSLLFAPLLLSVQLPR